MAPLTLPDYAVAAAFILPGLIVALRLALESHQPKAAKRTVYGIIRG
jgi:hypothetical protein